MNECNNEPLLSFPNYKSICKTKHDRISYKRLSVEKVKAEMMMISFRFLILIYVFSSLSKTRENNCRHGVVLEILPSSNIFDCCKMKEMQW